MDINLPGMNGIECVRQLKLAHPGIEFIMLTVYEDTESVFNALAAGASGYLLKLVPRPGTARSHPASPCGRLAHDQPYRPQGSAVLSPTRAGGGETTKLSPREQEVLEYLAKGFLYKEISSALDISYDTVHNHIRHIYEKLHVRSRTQAVTRYLDSVHPPAKPAQ